MIISLRGTSGSGKSHLVRRVVDLYADHDSCYAPHRRKPLYATHRRENGRPLMVPGHYEIQNGGVDTLPTLDDAYELARLADGRGHDVLMEGKCMSDGVRHVLALREEGRDVRVVHVARSVEQCVASVRARGHNIAEASVARTHEKVKRDVGTFRDTGVRVAIGDRDACLEMIIDWLRL